MTTDHRLVQTSNFCLHFIKLYCLQIPTTQLNILQNKINSIPRPAYLRKAKPHIYSKQSPKNNAKPQDFHFRFVQHRLRNNCSRFHCPVYITYNTI